MRQSWGVDSDMRTIRNTKDLHQFNLSTSTAARKSRGSVPSSILCAFIARDVDVVGVVQLVDLDNPCSRIDQCCLPPSMSCFLW